MVRYTKQQMANIDYSFIGNHYRVWCVGSNYIIHGRNGVGLLLNPKGRDIEGQWTADKYIINGRNRRSIHLTTKRLTRTTKTGRNILINLQGRGESDMTLSHHILIYLQIWGSMGKPITYT